MHTPQLPFALPNLPVLSPDETLYSWCGHVHAWNGNSSVLHTSRQLFSSAHAGLLHDFPSHLDTLQNRTFGLLPDTHKLALNHSLLGYYLPFQDKKLSLHILDSIILGNLPQIKYLLGLPASRVGGNHPLKFCPYCLKHDLESYGHSIWHIQHQRPSTFLCTAHNQPLHFTQISKTPVHLRYWISANNVTEVSIPKISSEHSRQCLLKLANLSEFVHQMPTGSLNSQILAWTYQSRLQEIGLLSKRGNIKIRLLTKAVAGHYKGCELLPGFNILDSLNNSSGGFVGSVSRKHPSKAHPLKHLLLMNYLFNNWDDMIKLYNEVQNHLPNWIAPVIEPKTVTDSRIEPFIDLIRQHGLSITRASSQIGISVTTGTQWAKQHGIKFTPRVSSLTPQKLNEVKRQLIKGALKKSVAARTGISLVSINRLLAVDNDLKLQWVSARLEKNKKQYRKTFQKVIRNHPGLPIKILRKIKGNGYHWLYRHDRDWLRKHLPSLWNNIG